MSDLRQLWAIKAQFSTRPNWASKTMVFLSVYFSLTNAQCRWFQKAFAMPSPAAAVSLPLMREVDSPQAKTEGEKQEE